MFTNVASGLGNVYNGDVIRLINLESIIFIDQTTNISTDLAAENIIWGTVGSENLIGTEGDNLIDSYGGDDWIEGNGGRVDN